MTLMRIKRGIDKTEGAGSTHRQIRFADALQRVFLTTVASYRACHGSVRQEKTGNR